MSLIHRIKAGRDRATKDKDKATKSILTLLLGEVQRFQDKPSDTPTDAEIIDRIISMIKGINTTIVNRIKLGKPTDDLEHEKIVLDFFLPKALTDEELNAAIDAAIADINATSMKQMGPVMGILSKKYKGTYDPSVAKDVVISKLKGK